MTRVVVISQARLGSQRLAGKVLMEINGRSLLDIHFSRLKHAETVSDIFFAIPEGAADEPLAKHIQSLGGNVCRGSENDVLERFVHCARASRADIVVRVTADCPFIAPEIVDQTVRSFMSTPSTDYAYMDLSTCSRGFDVEVFSAEALYRAGSEAVLPYEREHVTPYLYQHPDIFNILPVMYSCKGLENGRLCVDTTEDFKLASAVASHFGENISTATADQIMRYLESSQDVLNLNNGVAQKLL